MGFVVDKSSSCSTSSLLPMRTDLQHFFSYRSNRQPKLPWYQGWYWHPIWPVFLLLPENPLPAVSHRFPHHSIPAHKPNQCAAHREVPQNRPPSCRTTAYPPHLPIVPEACCRWQ